MRPIVSPGLSDFFAACPAAGSCESMFRCAKARAAALLFRVAAPPVKNF